MKFVDGYEFKHNNCRDVFIRVTSVVVDSGQAAIVWAYWMIQGIDGYWYASEPQRIMVRMNQYDNWKFYQPNGEVRYA